MELELQQRVAVISSSRSSVKGAVAGGHINAAIRVRAQSRVARPDAAFAPVRRNVQHRLLLERLRVVRHHPAVVRIHVAGRAPRKIESLVREQQGRPRVFSQRVELYFPVLASIAPAPNSRSEEHTSELQSRLHLVCRLLLEKKKQTAQSLLPIHTMCPCGISIIPWDE